MDTAPSTFKSIFKSMDSILTVSEIETQFDAEWILVSDPQTDESLEVKGGVVLWHSPDRDEVYQKAIELHPKRFAVLYTGTLPEDAAIIL
jgi:hypothetical protein